VKDHGWTRRIGSGETRSNGAFAAFGGEFARKNGAIPAVAARSGAI